MSNNLVMWLDSLCLPMTKCGSLRFSHIPTRAHAYSVPCLMTVFTDCLLLDDNHGRLKNIKYLNWTRDANVSSISHPHIHSASYRFTTLWSHSSVLGCNDIFLWKWIKNLYMNCARIASWRQRLWKAATRDHHHLAFRLHMANGITTIPRREFNTHTHTELFRCALR